MDALLEQRIQYLERTLSTKSRSPIVVQLASLYLEAGRPHDALRYCDDAIAHFPHYTTAHLVRAKVLSALEMKAEARREYEIVHSILPDIELLKAKLDEIPASETETFAEPAPAEDLSATAAEETFEEATTHTPVSAEEDQPAQAETEPREESMVEEEFVAPSEENSESQEEAPAEQDVVLEATTDDPFGIGSSEEAPITSEETMTEVPADEGSIEENTFGDLGPVEAEAAPAEGEATPEGRSSYEEFADAMRRELSGTEGTASIKEFLEVDSQEDGGEEQANDEIGELTEKLQNAPKITPIIDITEKKAPPPSEEDTPAGTGFVTPTLAEIYAKQGWYEDAIVAYKTLARIKPAEKERFEKRIQELEELKRSEESGA